MPRPCRTYRPAAAVPLLLALAAAEPAGAQSPPSVLLLPGAASGEEPAPLGECLPEAATPGAVISPPAPLQSPLAPSVPQLPPASPPPSPPPHRPTFGIGVRGLGSWTLNGSPYSQYGLGGALLLRVSPHLTAELHAQYHSTVALIPTGPTGVYSDRSELPILLGFRLGFGPAGARLSPYLAVAVGADYARSQTATVDPTAWYFASTYGAGAELHLGTHCSLLVEVRGNTLVRLDQPDPATATPTNQTAAEPATLQGIQLAGGVEVYF